MTRADPIRLNLTALHWSGDQRSRRVKVMPVLRKIFRLVLLVCPLVLLGSTHVRSTAWPVEESNHSMPALLVEDSGGMISVEATAHHDHTEPARRFIKMEVTAYCPCKMCCGKNAMGITASGKPVSYNNGQFVAADTRLLPFGTKVIIPGYANETPVEVTDRGGLIKGNKLDVYFDDHQAALKWGRQIIEVEIVN